MKFYPLIPVCIFAAASPLIAAELPKPVVIGLKNPESVCLGADRLIYVTEIGEFGTDGDGQVSVIKDGKPVPFATGLNDPKGIVTWENAFYVTDKTRIVKIDQTGKATTFVGPEKFPTPPQFLNDIA